MFLRGKVKFSNYYVNKWKCRKNDYFLNNISFPAAYSSVELLSLEH